MTSHNDSMNEKTNEELQDIILKAKNIIKSAESVIADRRHAVEYEGYRQWLYCSNSQYLTIHDALHEYNNVDNANGYNMSFIDFAKRFKQDFRGVTTRTPDGRRTVYKKIHKDNC
jgi:hypothetical protein